jgi:hypothetical protein
MKPNKPGEKKRTILKGLAKGRSCERLLADDPTLTYHDIFRAVSETPTTFWKKKPAPKHSAHSGVS